MATLPNHIAVFSLAYAPMESGAEIACREIMTRLPTHRFTVFTHRFERSWGADEAREHIRIIRTGSDSSRLQKFAYALRAWRAAEAAHRREPFSATWVIMASYGGIAALLFKLWHPRVPLLLTLQEGDSEEHILRRVGIFYPLWRMLFRRADHIQVISTYLRDFARRHGARCPITVIPNGVDIDKLKVKSSKVKVSDERIIVTTSRLVHKNGVDILIRAFAKLKKMEMGNLRLEIVGDGPERDKLEQLARELGVADYVQFVGQVPYKEISAYLARADIFVRPSRSEGLGSSFLEAMAAGLPVIGTPVGGIPDFLKDGETGLFARVDDSADLAEKMQMLLTDAELRERLATAGAKVVREQYSWDQISRDMEAIFLDLRVRRRVLIATGLFPPEIGGPATYSALLAEELPKRGFSADVLAFGTVRHLPRLARHMAYAWKAFQKGRHADIIFAQDPVSVGFPAALAAFLLRKPFLLKIVGDYAWEQAQERFGVRDLLDAFLKKRYGIRVELLRSIERFVARRAKRIIVPSEYLKRVVEVWGVRAKRIVVIPNAVQGAHAADRRAARAALGVEGFLILSAGRLVPWKGFDYVIRAVAELKKNIPELELMIAGEGPERTRLEAITEERGARAYVRFAGSLPKAELVRALSAADVFVLHTGYEGFSHQIIEALALRVPVITTNVGGNPEIVKDGENGLLTPYGNLDALTGAIRRLASDGAFRRRLGEASGASIRQFTSEAMLDRLHECLLCSTP